MPTEVTIEDPKAIKVLLSKQALTYLQPYLGASRSIGEAAERIGRSIQRTHYWTHRLAAVGLLQVRGTVPRSGRPIRRYQAIADSFRITAQSLPVGLFESMIAVPNRALVRAFQSAYPDVAYGADVWIHPGQGASGIILDRRLPDAADEGPDDALLCSFTVRLGLEDARQLRAELAALRDRWSSKDSPRASGHPIYLSFLALTPLPDDD